MKLNVVILSTLQKVGADIKSSAFVYGVYSLLDKFANGFLLWYLVTYYSTDIMALKSILAISPSLSAIGCALFTGIGVTVYYDKIV